jgi:hypothetical protein
MTQDTELDFRKAESFELGYEARRANHAALRRCLEIWRFRQNHSAKLTGAGPAKNRN